MRVGILTFHASHNYGALLQCWALHRVLVAMGCEAVVLDRWITKDNSLVRWPFTNTIKEWMKYLVRGFLGCGDFRRAIRSLRTMRFLRDVNLTSYHFMSWSDVPKPIDLDCVVVGSDQVWQPFWNGENPYLLHGAPDSLRSIAYAASFGVNALPSEKRDAYRVSLQRFSNISCRETSGSEIVKELGLTVTHVVDPTLLIDPVIWRGRVSCVADAGRKIVCYFLGESISECLPVLRRFSQDHDVEIEVFSDGYLKSLSRAVRDLISLSNVRTQVRIQYAAGPMELLQSIATAGLVVTDSFHGLMFSSVFNRNVRFVRPHDERRRVMFSRVEEFVNGCMKGPVLIDSVREGLMSFSSGEKVCYDQKKIAEQRVESQSWLKKALGV